jgi:hypothetical protein
MEIQVEVPEKYLSEEITLWLVDPGPAADISHGLGHGQFSPEALRDQPSTISRGVRRFSARTNAVHTREPGRRGPIGPQERVIAVLRVGADPSYRVLEVLHAEVATEIRVRVEGGTVQIREPVARPGAPAVRIGTSRSGDSVSWRLD